MSALGRALIFIGITIAFIGILLVSGAKLPWLGKLPGDIYVEKKNFTFYFPLATSILISIILSAIILFLRRR